VNVPVPDEFVELIAQRAAEIVTERVTDTERTSAWPAAMTVETAARYTDSSPERLRKLVASRRIPFAQEAPGCAIRFLRSDLDEWLHSQRHEARRS
jgi:excisionase family DNA binding protein